MTVYRSVFMALLSGALLGACGGSEDSAAVVSLSATPAEIEEGGSANLTASFSGGNGSIDQGVGAVRSGIPVQVTPVDDTVFTLTVGEGAGATTATASLRIVYAERWDFEAVDGWVLVEDLAAGPGDSGASARIQDGQLELRSGQGEDGRCARSSASRSFGDSKLRAGRYESVDFSFFVESAGGFGMGHATVSATYGGKSVDLPVPDEAATVSVRWKGDHIEVLVNGVPLPASGYAVRDDDAEPAVAAVAHACAADLTSLWLVIEAIEISAR